MGGGGNSRFGDDRPPREEGDFGRSDGARDWRRGERKAGPPPAGGRFGDGAQRGGFRDKWATDGPRDGQRWGGRDQGRMGGGRSGLGQRPAHLRKLFGRKGEEPESSNSNSFATLSQDVRNQGSVSQLGRPGIKGFSRREEESGKPNNTKTELTKNVPAGTGPATGIGGKKPGKKKSPLEVAMDEGNTVSMKHVKSGLKKLDLNDDETGSKLGVSFAKSLQEGKLSLTQIEGALVKEAASEGIAARLLAVTLNKLKNLKLEGDEEKEEEDGEERVTKLIETSKFDALKALKRKKTAAEFTTFLATHELEFLKGGPDTMELIEVAFEEGKKPSEIVTAVNSIVGENEDMSMCTRKVAELMAKEMFKKGEKKANLTPMETYEPLLQRCLVGNQGAAAQILFAMQNEWFASKMGDDEILAAFTKAEEKMVTHEEFESWRSDKKEKSKSKPKALLAVFKFLEELRAKNKPIEEDVDEDAADEDEGVEEEEFDATPTFV